MSRLRRVGIVAALLVSTVACAGKATTERCGDEMSGTRTLSDGREARRSVGAQIPGYEMLVPTSSSQEPTKGALCRVADGRELWGVEAFREGRGATEDPALHAALAMTVLEAGVAGEDPWTPGGEAVAGAQAPQWSGEQLVYWRRHAQLANWVRVTVDGATGAVRAELDTAIAAPQGDLVARAKARLASDALPERQAAVKELAASDDPAAHALLFEAARSNEAWRVRQDAVRRLGERPVPGADGLLIEVLGADAQAEVRTAAATALGKLGDAGATDALSRAASSDASPAVRAAANGALAQLR